MPSFARATIDLHSAAPDLIPQDKDAATAWNTVRNVFFRNGESVRALGDAPTLPTVREPSAVETMVYANLEDAFWVYCTETGIYAHDGSSEFDITPVGGWSGIDENKTFTSCVLNGYAVINCSDRDPVYWSGVVSEPCEILPGWPAAGRTLCMRAHKSFLLSIGHVSDGRQRVRWSSAAPIGGLPAEWEPSATNLAGFADLAPLSSACLEGRSLRDQFLVYKAESIWSFTFVGGNFVFQTRKVFAERGIAATNALTTGPADEHLFIGSDGDCYLHDAVNIKSILSGRGQRDFYADFTSNPTGKFSAGTLMREKLGVLAYPNAAGVDGTNAILFDFESGDVGYRTLPNIKCMNDGPELKTVAEQNTWDGNPFDWNDNSKSWNTLVVARSNNDLLVGGLFTDSAALLISDAGSDVFYPDTPVQALLEKAGLHFGNPQSRIMVTRIWPKMIGRPQDVVQIRVGGQEITGGPISWSLAQDFVIGSPDPLSTFASGRYISFEIVSNGAAVWRIGSIGVEYREQGTW